MRRWTLALSAIAIGFVLSSPAHAEYRIVKWSYGDCKIWHEDGNKPSGEGWKVYKRHFKDWDHAWKRLGKLIAHKRCAP